MSAIYGYNNEFNPSDVVQQLKDISKQLEVDNEEVDENEMMSHEERLNLVNKQLMLGLRLSTGYFRF